MEKVIWFRLTASVNLTYIIDDSMLPLKILIHKNVFILDAANQRNMFFVSSIHFMREECILMAGILYIFAQKSVDFKLA